MLSNLYFLARIANRREGDSGNNILGRPGETQDGTNHMIYVHMTEV